ncbi:ester cyclase [Chloroflexota bacterium]
MGVEENRKILQRYLDELLNNGDFSKASEILHEDYSGSAGGGLKGVEGLKQFRNYMRSRSSDMRFNVEEMIAEGNKIAIFGEWSGTADGEYLGIPATHKPFSYVLAAVYEFQDGKVIRGLTRSVSNQLDVFQQLGILPSIEEIANNYKESH